ncbi:nucleotide sugar dehydrogenase [Paenibacillus sediminis]|uniref:UDP-N-acetyl-D-glucosamine dehydrogenase n=1 Tax=Paenibacillus sediminis TaxID=664909 RepID=A0ABS4H190_9BACL|nr:nucleotide sugar dehydrogenase [Paenibacillus sediminis]MBP1936251.1 UDP-N-acetyl-D-glucosamine dehydrogenase [Paenibacillus sediminis]
MQTEKKRIGIVGLGYVGLPLAIMLADKGFNVTGIDPDLQKLAKLDQGISYINDIEDDRIQAVISANQFKALSDFNALKQVESIVICVPTPLTEQGTPDLSYIQSAGEQISRILQNNQLIILESTTYPGTTREVLLPILEQSGLKAGIDFNLAYSPERIDPGNKSFTVNEIPKILSGLTQACKEKAFELYSKIYKTVVLVSSTEVAEMAKILENSYRFINISFINEMAILCDHLHLDIWEIIQAANTKPYGFQAFYPGPGIGGHCIPVDPMYLQWKAKQNHYISKFIEFSDAMNLEMVKYIVNRTEQLLVHKKPLKGANILLYGVTYKGDIADTRDSAAFLIIHELKQAGANVSYHDPYIPSITIDQETLNSVQLTDAVLAESDCLIVLTNHSALPAQQILEHTSLVFDTRHTLFGHKGKAKVCFLGGGEP